MDILIFTDNPSVNETQLVLEEAKARCIIAEMMTPWNVSIPNVPKIDAKLVYVTSNMLNRGSTFELIHRFLILQEFKKQIGVIINPLESMQRYSKEHLTIQMQRLNIPHPRTLATENVEHAYKFATSILESGHNVVLKPICRGQGVGVVMLDKIHRREDLLQFLIWYNRTHAQGVFYLQEFIPNQGYDVRCFVIDGEVVGREKRSNPRDFRYNVSAGGFAEPFEDPIYDELAVKVAEAVGLKITGIDVLPAEDGSPYILEANCFPGYKALMESTGILIYKKIVDYFQRIIRG